jgi:hypothetical protein
MVLWAPDFFRCTGLDESASWVGSSCNTGNYNAGSGGAYNVSKWVNDCNTRVWLHQFTSPKDATSGWSYCASPNENGTPPAQDVNPENIQVVSNADPC